MVANTPSLDHAHPKKINNTRWYHPTSALLRAVDSLVIAGILALFSMGFRMIIIWAGDVIQPPPMEDPTKTGRPAEYSEDCINQIFKRHIFLICKSPGRKDDLKTNLQVQKTGVSKQQGKTDKHCVGETPLCRVYNRLSGRDIFHVNFSQVQDRRTSVMFVILQNANTQQQSSPDIQAMTTHHVPFSTRGLP